MVSVPYTLIEIARAALEDGITRVELHLSMEGSWVEVSKLQQHGDTDVRVLNRGTGGQVVFVGPNMITAVRTTPPTFSTVAFI